MKLVTTWMATEEEELQHGTIAQFVSGPLDPVRTMQVSGPLDPVSHVCSTHLSLVVHSFWRWLCYRRTAR